MTKTKKVTKRRKGQTATKVTVIRKGYMLNLIAGVRSQIAKDPATMAAIKEAGKGAIPWKWLDAEILCSVVEKDILKNRNV